MRDWGYDEYTSYSIYKNRRAFLKGAIALGLMPSQAFAQKSNVCSTFSANVHTSKSAETPFQLVSSYNNYYEFSTNKKAVKHISKEFDTSNWQVKVDGLVENPMILDLKSISNIPKCKRTYKLRCVEGWSAVIPWKGFELNHILAEAKPKKNAKYVLFTSILDPAQMPGQRSSILPWPYTEALRLDEAMHWLTIMATGMYDQALPNQNGAPIRLVVPWKYGYKSIKAVTRITLVDSQPTSSWSQTAPSEYGFYGNVNPKVAHPRWSQRRELPLGQSKKIKTQLLNGYAEQLSELYQHDDLNKLF